MVFYLVLLGVRRRPRQTTSSGVFERYRFFQDAACTDVSTDSAKDEVDAGCSGDGCSDDIVVIDSMQLFRATGSGVGGDRRNRPSNYEDALPVQRTSALLLLAVPSEVSLSDLRNFLGEACADTEVFRMLRREDVVQSVQTGRKGAFYSVVLLCRTQESADALYKRNHGRLFFTEPPCGAASPAAASSPCHCSTSPPLLAFDAPSGWQSTGCAGPCCYMVFLEVVVYIGKGAANIDVAGMADTSRAELLAQDVPTAAYQMPACPLCVERLDISGTGMVTHSQGWLSALAYPPASCCQACAVISDLAEAGEQLTSIKSTAACARCANHEELSLWVCLICGHLGCGRYAAGHAKDHATEEKHRFCLELATGRIWDYSGDVFVHRRLVQMAAASGGRFEVALPAPAADEGGHPGDRPKQTWPGYRDESDLAMELDAILASQLDHQRFLYEAQLGEALERRSDALDAERAAVDEEARVLELSRNELADAERRRRSLEKQLATAQRSKHESEEKLSFVKELNSALLANKKEIAATPAGGTGGNPGAGAATSAPSTDGAAKCDAEEDDALVLRLRRRVEQLMAQISEADAGASGSSDGARFAPAARNRAHR